jgi:dihydroorotase
MTTPARPGDLAQPTLVVANGTVIDPAAGLHARVDVGIAGDRIVAVGPNLPRDGVDVLDAGGRLVTPGLIDLHAHLFEGMSQLGVDADTTCLPAGVTTAVDAGTAGEIAFDRFARDWLRRSTTRTYAFVNLSSIGLPIDDGLELGDSILRYIDVPRIVDVIEANRDVCLGVKVRVATYQMRHGFGPLNAALEATARTGTHLMVHITEPGIALDAVFDRLRPGDIVTHLFHGRRERIVGSDGKVLDSLRRAVARGVRTDIGHGGGSFTFATARAALADGFKPDTISTDLHPFSLRGAMRDLPTTMSKFLALDMTLDEVDAATTVNAAKSIDRPELTGTLAVGSPADVAVLQEVVGPVVLEDTAGDRITADRELRPWATIRNGRVVWSAA